MNTEQPKVFDTKTVIAIVMVGAVWVLWQMYMERKYGSTVAPTETAAPAVSGVSTDSTSPKAEPTTTAPAPSPAELLDSKVAKSAAATTTAYDSGNLQLTVNSQGFAIQNVVLKTQTDRDGQPIRLGHDSEPVFELRDKMTKGPIPFVVSRESDNVFVGTYTEGEMKMQARLEFAPMQYSFSYNVKIQNARPGFQGVLVKMAEHIHNTDSGTFFMPAFEFNESLVVHDGSSDRNRLTRTEAVDKNYNNATLVSLGSHYFAIAALDLSSVLPQARLYGLGEQAMAMLDYSPIKGVDNQEISLKGFMGPKSLELVSAVDERLVPLVNFGPLSWLARPILALMKGLFSVFNNYGVAIILLTIIVRLLVLPFNIMQIKSMKAMQAVQPQMKALREKFKDDPQQLNLRTMELMRTHKVNPLGGCLPMLLQLPVFFALYQVLGQSIELYKSPFAFWIQDLSVKDPYFVLPILMGIAMFVQQKLTPTTMDPAQAKVMMVLPLVFTAMMVTLPSGLTLYIFVSTLFGIVQQMVFMRDQNLAVSPA
jgi:YidC/Oxa1 family membrane protein insertase